MLTFGKDALSKLLVAGSMYVFTGLVLADTITLAADKWCPYNCEPDSDRPGFIVEIARAALEPYGHTIVYKVLPWKRAIYETENGKISGVLTTEHAVTPSFIFPKSEQAFVQWGIYVKSNDPWRYNGLGSLNGRTIGVISDYGYREFGAYFEQNPRAVKLDTVFLEKSLESNIKKLLMGRIDTTIEDPLVMSLHLHTTNRDGQIIMVGSGEHFPIYIGFSPKNPKSSLYAQQLSDGMTSLRESGTFAKIMARYGLKDWRNTK